MRTGIDKCTIVFAVGLALSMFAKTGLAAFNSGSTGADGAFNPTASTEVQLPASGIFNYTSVNIPVGVTITYRKNTTNTPVTILVSGDFVHAGIIDISGTAAPVASSAAANSAQPGIGGPGGYNGGRGGLMAGGSTRLGGDGLGAGGGKTALYNGGQSGGGGGGYGDGGGDSWPPASNGGSTYGSSFLLPLLGGSGGGGGSGGTSGVGSGGSGGGGAILIAASGTVDIQPTSGIYANGGNASEAGDGGCGGAGSGGAIRIVATTVKGSGQLVANGGAGNGGCGTNPAWGRTRGGSGGTGRIRIEAENFAYGSSSNSPTPSADLVVGPVFIPSQPTLRISSVAGTAAPSAPTGNRDVELPTSTTNPVTVEFASSGIPLGTTVTLTVKPAAGIPITATSTALSGTVSNATASASVNLPTAHSVLTATVSYTTTAALGNALGVQYAKGEYVERIEISAGMSGASTTTLITVSGKRYLMPDAIAAIPRG